MNTDRFDVEAKGGREINRQEMMPILRAIPEDRSQVKEPVHSLVIDRIEKPSANGAAVRAILSSWKCT